MEYSPPPLFKQGPPALARLIFFVGLALVLLVSDARFKTLEIVRGVLDAGLYPLQRAALVPRDLLVGATHLAVSTTTLRADNEKLAAQNLQLSVEANRNASLAAENAHLRALLELSRNVVTQSTPAEVQYDMRDPFTQKVIIGRGSRQGIQSGAPVVSEDGMIGQVTRVFPMQSEVTLLTDKDQAVPVQIVRTSLRGVVYGTPAGNALQLRFVPIGADIVAGDELVTSGLDGVYPPGLPVAKVVRVDRQSDTAFARVDCAPVSAVRGARDLLVLHYQADIPPRPEPETPLKDGKSSTNAGKAAGKGQKSENAERNGKAGKAGKAAEPSASQRAASTPAAKAPGEPGRAAPAPASSTSASASASTLVPRSGAGAQR